MTPTPQPPAPHPILETMAAPKEGFEWTLIPGENPNCYASWKQRLKVQPPERVQALQPTPNVSGTPRTDAFEKAHAHLYEAIGSYVYPRALDHARQLECELAAALARAEKAEKDTRRLDWLDEQAKPETFEDAPHSMVWCLIGASGETDLRAAIDAALTPTKEPAP